MAEERREASDLVKSKVREESERLKKIPAWEQKSETTLDPRNRVGEEATKIMDEKEVASQEALSQVKENQFSALEVEPKMGVNENSKQDREHRERLESGQRVQEKAEQESKAGEEQPKTAKYDSIDPLAEQGGEAPPFSTPIWLGKPKAKICPIECNSWV